MPFPRRPLPPSPPCLALPPPLSLTRAHTDEFIAHVGREKEESERQEMLERDKRKLRGPLDPLTETLLSFEDEDALEAKIADIYGLLDEDESGGLNFEEFRDGVKRLSDKIHLTQDDFGICACMHTYLHTYIRTCMHACLS